MAETLWLKSNKNTAMRSCSEGKINVSFSKECSMCGDVGFAEKLFKCNFCLFRYQHTYCSSIYPTSDHGDSFSCEWCIYAQNKRTPTDFKNTISERQSIPPSKEGRSIQRRENSELVVGVEKRVRVRVRVHAPRRYRRLADF